MLNFETPFDRQAKMGIPFFKLGTATPPDDKFLAVVTAVLASNFTGAPQRARLIFPGNDNLEFPVEPGRQSGASVLFIVCSPGEPVTSSGADHIHIQGYFVRK
jgi:hypothetical protein